MGKRGATKKEPKFSSGFHNPSSLREESTGRKQTKGSSNNSKSTLKVEHLQKEAMGVPPDPSLFSCERCDTFLQPGFNCTVRIEKNRAKARCGQKKSNNSTLRNVVIYKCHFCSHWNLKRGTQKGHMKEISPSKSKTSSKSETAKVRLQKCGKRNQSISKKPAETNSTPTRVEKAVTSSNKRRRKSWTSLKEIAESTEHASSEKITSN
ncbi:hypothetical protein SLA2020_281030 [Shorea laevis]